MTKQKVIEQMVQIANELTKNYTWDKFNALLDLCSDWNEEHEEEYIFMCDHVSEETGLTNGFYIEDDYWIISDNWERRPRA